MERFERLIYPIWGKIMKTEKALEKTEIEVLHEADLAIYNSGHKPERFVVNAIGQQTGHQSAMYS